MNKDETLCDQIKKALATSRNDALEEAANLVRRIAPVSSPIDLYFAILSLKDEVTKDVSN